jgi:hypothetical protein
MFFDHAPLLRKVLHGGTYIPNPKHSIDYLLDVIPCDNTYNLGNGTYGHVEWSSDNACDNPHRKNQDPFTYCWPFPSGEYNGLDYMLYHNLWYLKEYNNGNASIQDISKRIVRNINLPVSPFVPGISIDAFETIDVDNTTITSNGSGYMRAGKEIDLGPGTYFQSGANLDLYIQRYTCASDNHSIRLAGSNQGTDPVYHHEDYPAEQTMQAEPLVTGELNSPLVSNIAGKPIAVSTDGEGETYLYPNPTEEKSRLFFKIDKDEIASVKVLNVPGKEVLRIENIQSSAGEAEIDMSLVPKGTYVVKFLTSKGRSESKKLIKQ